MNITVSTTFTAKLSRRNDSAVRLVLIAIWVCGAFAALRVSPALWITTAAIAGLVYRGSRNDGSLVTKVTPDDTELLPPATRRLVLATRQKLTSADATYLLQVVVEGAGPLLRAMDGREGSASSRRDVVALVEASCGLSEELDRVDAFLAQPRAPGDARGAELRERSAKTRAQLADRLTEACTAIETLHAQLLEERSDAADRVAELAAELTEEARVRRQAAGEIADLLK
jgi:hypothetical protein